MEDESGFTRIWAIIKHHGNDEQDYVFIYVVWFEDVLRQDELLSCPIYRLQKDTNNSWHRIHPISTVKSISEFGSTICAQLCTGKFSHVLSKIF